MTVPAAGLTDATVIADSHRRPDAFAALYDRYAPLLYRYAYRRLGPETAEDVVADTFLAAFSRRHTYDPRQADARPWLFGILTREIARHFRREDARYRALARAAVQNDGPDTVTDSAERIAATVTAAASSGRLAAALRDLPPEDRDTLLLFAWAELSYQQIAQTLDIPVGTVRSRLNRVRRTLRDLFDGRDPLNSEEDDHA